MFVLRISSVEDIRQTLLLKVEKQMERKVQAKL